ncbi:MAG: hypothetical protein HY825_04325 [Acidobacteria bacterium]|nr:hypothetical protein [Acidobacteriota bacterium]
MRRTGEGSTVTEGRVFGHDGAGVVALTTPQHALAGLFLGGSPARLVVHARTAMQHVIPWPGTSSWQWRQPATPRVPLPERLAPGSPQPIPEESTPQARRDRLHANGTWASSMPGPTTRSRTGEWEWLRRLVGLSGLGWAFVLTAVCWELFAVALSLCAGWGWDKGAGFFAWGLGILALGFYLRTSRQSPAVSRLFLGVNILVVGVLSLVVATR